MKTCSFGGARPRTMNEGLFCLREPEARYDVSACNNCGLCYPRNDSYGRPRRSVVKYSQAHEYLCLNGYRIILNCSAVGSWLNYKKKNDSLWFISVILVLSYTEYCLCSEMSMWSIRIHWIYHVQLK